MEEGENTVIMEEGENTKDSGRYDKSKAGSERL